MKVEIECTPQELNELLKEKAPIEIINNSQTCIDDAENEQVKARQRLKELLKKETPVAGTTDVNNS